MSETRSRDRTNSQEWLDGVAESAFQRDVLEAAGYLGYLRYHSHDSRRDNEAAGVDPGYPDATLVHPAQDRLIIAELKAERGRHSDGQRRWLDALERVRSVEVYRRWRPRDMDRILEILQGER